MARMKLARFRPVLWTALLVAAALGAPRAARAQKAGRDTLLRTHPQVVAAFKELTEKGSQCTLRILSGGKDAALATVVGPDGWLITKASEVKGKPKLTCKLKDGKEVEVQVINTGDTHDIALLKIEATELTAVVWADSRSAEAGHWIVSPGADGKPAAIGVMSVATRHIAVSKNATTDPLTPGDLGIEMNPDEAAAVITRVHPGGPGVKAGVKVKDTIVAVDGKEVLDAESLLTVLQNHKPGDTVKVRLKRGDEEVDLSIASHKPTAGKAGNLGDSRNAWGSKLSTRRSGFPTFFQHDSVVLPTDCGGPVLDLDGRVIGINIARAGRTETYSIPAEVLVPVVKKLMRDKPKK